MSQAKQDIHVAVIGAGPAGYPAAFHAADLGMKVTLIDPEANPGGVCLYRGCIPSKALLHMADLINEAKLAAEHGVSFGAPQIDLDKLRAFKDGVIAKLTGGTGMLAKQRKVTTLQGLAKFKDNKTLLVDLADGGTQELGFDYAIIATGSRPVVIPGWPQSPRVMDSTGALALPDIPGSLLVVGGGYIGLELGQVYAALGAQVSVVEMMPQLVPGADKDLIRILEKRLKQQFDQIMLKTKVAEMKEVDEGIQVSLEDQNQEVVQQTYDKVLVAIGRRPYCEGLGLENTAVELTEQGFIKTDAQRRTAEAHIFAVGDIAGQPMLAHKGTAEAKVAVEAISGRKAIFEPRAIPAVMFTDPEIAWCGVTEVEARDQGLSVETSSFPWAASGRATSLARNDGLTKLVLEPKTLRVLGMGLAGHGAGELISEGVLAVEMGAVAEDLALSIHPHPTLSETIMEAAEAADGQSIHAYRPKRG